MSKRKKAADRAPCPECGNLSLMLLGRKMRGLVLEIARERDRQDAKWGEQDHDPFVWAAILTEEVGEVAQAALKARFEGGRFGRAANDIRDEAIQVAAVALAFAECLDRRTWTWGNHAKDSP